MRVREAPPLRLSHDIKTPNGRHYRWAEDEANPANVIRRCQQSDTMPGGFESSSGLLPRNPQIDYSDLERFSTWRTLDVFGGVVSETRLEASPRVSGHEFSVTPNAVGWQAALEDRKDARMIYRDMDIAKWSGASAQRKVDQEGVFGFQDPSMDVDESTGTPILKTVIADAWGTNSGRPMSEALYSARGIPIASVYGDWRRGTAVDAADPRWNWRIGMASDDRHTASVDTGNLRAVGPGSTTLSDVSGSFDFAWVDLFYANVAGGTAGVQHEIMWRVLAVHGLTGLTKQGDEPNAGFYASDIVRHAVQTWAPLLVLKKDSIQQSSLVIPQAAYLEPTTAAEIIRDVSRYALPDWGVGPGREFFWVERGARARRWRLRIGPSELEETGPQASRIWNSIIVQYQDVDGTARTVGPPDSRSDTETVDLEDLDPDNPANILGLTRRDLLIMGISTPEGAIEVGRRFLEESKLLDRSGRARAVGWIEDDRGVTHPYHSMSAGDYAAFVDASDKSYRRIIKTEKDHDSRTVTFDLDAPPEGLDALLEQLGVSLIPLGFSS